MTVKINRTPWPTTGLALGLLAAGALASPATAQDRLQCLFGGTPPLSGISAGTGKSIVAGGDLAAAQVSKALDIDVKVGWRDGQNLPAPTVTGFQALAAEGAAGVLVNGTDPLLAAAPLGERLKTIVFNIAAVTPAQRKMNPYVFGNAVLADTESRQMVDAIKNVFGMSSMTIVYDDNAFGGMFRAFLTDAAEQSGVKVTQSIAVKPGASDLRPHLRPLKDVAEHEAIVLASTGITPGTAIRQAKEIGVKSRYWIGEQFTWVPDALKAAGESAEGAIATTPLFDRTASERAQTFAIDYEAATGLAPDALAGRAYDAIYAMAVAAKAAGSCEGADVRDELVKMDSYAGVSGDLDFSKQIAEGKLAWGKVVDGKVTSVKVESLK